MEHMPKRNAITCFPNKEKAFQMGDKLKLYAYTTKDQSDWWALNLLSSTYQVLFQARFEKGNVTVRSNLEPWGEKESAWIVKTTFPSLLKNAAFFPVELENSPRTLMVRFPSLMKTFPVYHRLHETLFILPYGQISRHGL